MVKRKPGEIWKHKSKWFVQFPKGRMTFKTKEGAEECIEISDLKKKRRKNMVVKKGELIETQEKKQLTAQDVKAQVNLIQQVMASVMKEGTHFGTIPGCGDKPTLLKPGAEKIMATFRLAADPIIDDLSTEDEIRYRVTVRMLTFKGDFVGAGIGECSSNEEKYRWKRATCQEEWDATPENRRREKWKSAYGGKPSYQIKQIRTSISDVANTILKMAKKRGLVDGTLTATAASDIFAQDLEDTEGPIGAGRQSQGKPRVEKPKTQHEAMIDNFAKAKKSLGEKDYYHILNKFGYKHASEIKTVADGNKVMGSINSVLEVLR